MTKNFPFSINRKLKHKLDLLIAQLKRKDVWILLTGDEGSGKTNAAAYLLYYFHCITGREFSIENFYFDAEALFNYAKNTENKLLNWDEAALGGLSAEWYTQAQINLIKLAITGRKLHHVFILCIPRFEKLKEELRMDRIHAQIHMNCGRKNNKYGHAMYLTRRGIRYLNHMWKTKKVRLYGNAMRKCGGFGFDIPFVFDKVFTEEEQKRYEDKKSEAISNIGKKKGNEWKLKLNDLKLRIGGIKLPIENLRQLAENLGIQPKTMEKWRAKYKITKLKSDLSLSDSPENPIITTNGEDYFDDDDADEGTDKKSDDDADKQKDE